MRYLKRYNESTDEQKLVDEMEIKLWTVSFEEMDTLAKWEIESYDTDKLTRGGSKGYPKVNISRHYTHANSEHESDWYDYFKGMRTPGALLKNLNTTTKAWWDVCFIFDPGAMATKTTISDIVEDYGDNLDQFVDHLKINFDSEPKSIKYCPYGMGYYDINEWTSAEDILNNYKNQRVVGIRFNIEF